MLIVYIIIKKGSKTSREGNRPQFCVRDYFERYSLTLFIKLVSKTKILAYKNYDPKWAKYSIILNFKVQHLAQK